MRIAREGIPFLAGFLGLALAPGLVAASLGAPAWGTALAAAPGSGLALFSAWFFRDPERRPPEGEGVVVSPADGKIVAAVDDPSGPRLAIFLNVFDVHVNRAPIAGRVESVLYTEGRFLAAFDERAGEANERNDIDVSSGGRTVRMSQIAGLIARRIVCKVKPGDLLEAGQRVGLIRFGSRTDLVLPPGARICVRVGERVKGGETPVGWMPGRKADS